MAGPPISFPGPSNLPPLPQRPQEPMYGSMASDIGGALRQTGEDLGQFDKTLDAQAKQRALMDDMIRKREDAQRVQRAKEEWQQKEYDFQQAKEITRQEEEANREEYRKADDVRATSKEKRESDKYEAEQKTLSERKQNIKDFNEQLLTRQRELEKEGKTLSKREFSIIAAGTDLTGTPEYSSVMKAWFPNYNPNTGSKGGVYAKNKLTEEKSKRTIAFREAELRGLVQQLESIQNTKYDVSRMIQDPVGGLDYLIKQIPAESEKRADVQGILKEMRKKAQDINNAKISAGMEYSEPDTAGVSIEDNAAKIDALKKRIAEKKARLNTGGM